MKRKYGNKTIHSKYEEKKETVKIIL